MSEAMRTSHIKKLVDLLYKKLFKKNKNLLFNMVRGSYFCDINKKL